MRYSFEEIEFEKIDTKEYYCFPRKALFTTVEWLSFVKDDSKVTPLILRIIDENSQLVGYFTSMVAHKFGVKIIGSPFSGWSTCWMGFDVVDGVDKKSLIKPTVDYLLQVHNALFVQIIERDITTAEADGLKFNNSSCNTLELSINKTDEELFKVFKTDCRNYIRQFERRGARIEQVEPSDEFAAQYYEQLKDVFAKQGMVPTYGLDKVKLMMSHLASSPHILCLRVIDPEDNCIATSIFLGYNKKMFFWGGASYRNGQHYRPNEYMIWTAIKYWRDKGFEVFDMVGARDYKRKFGSHDVSYACMEFSRFPGLIGLKHFAGNMYFKMLNWKGKLGGKK